jgi:hypothetical protein
LVSAYDCTGLAHVVCPVRPRILIPARSLKLSVPPRSKYALRSPHLACLRDAASALNGFDLTGVAVGDILLVNEEVAAMLVREGWAEPVAGDSRNNPPRETPIDQ